MKKFAATLATAIVLTGAAASPASALTLDAAIVPNGPTICRLIPWFPSCWANR